MNPTPAVIHELVASLVAAYPSTNVADETKALWVGQLRKVSEPTARAAVQMLIREQRRFPVPADFWRAVEQHHNSTKDRPSGVPALPSVSCDECGGTGWTFTTPPEVTPGDVVACSRGCLPPRPSQHPHALREREEGDREYALDQIAFARTLLGATKRVP